MNWTNQRTSGKYGQGAERGRAMQEGLVSAIVGKPNAGKSSYLMHCLENSEPLFMRFPEQRGSSGRLSKHTRLSSLFN